MDPIVLTDHQGQLNWGSLINYTDCAAFKIY